MSHQEHPCDNEIPQLQRRMTVKRKLQKTFRGRRADSHQEDFESNSTASSGPSSSTQQPQNTVRVDPGFWQPELPLSDVSTPPLSLARQIAERKTAAARLADQLAQPRVERKSKFKTGFKKANRMIRALWTKEPAQTAAQTVTQTREGTLVWEGLQNSMSQRSAFNSFELAVTSALQRITEEEDDIEDP